MWWSPDSASSRTTGFDERASPDYYLTLTRRNRQGDALDPGVSEPRLANPAVDLYVLIRPSRPASRAYRRPQRQGLRQHGRRHYG